MMKKLLLFSLLTLLPLVASAAAVEIDGIYYNLINKTNAAEVTSNPDKYTGSVSIPEQVVYEGKDYSVTSIGESAFFGCSGLTSVTIPNSVTSIGNSAFYWCSSLKKVIVPDIAAWCSISFSDASANPLYYAHHLYSDENTEITDLILPNSVTSIGNYAFYGCSALTSVTIPNSVTSIGERAFRECSGLISVTIGNSVTSIGDCAFYDCSGLTSITIPNSVTSIGNNAFSYCSGLTSVTIPNSVTSIGGGAFSDCSALTSVTIPNSVTSIGACAFYGCSGLTSVTIPNSVTSIGDGAFDGCSGLTSVTIGSGVTSIGIYAFANCPELTDVYCLAENVPSTISNAFEKSYIEYATLHVPASSVTTYQAAEPWKNFKSIVTLDGSTPTPTPETPKCANPSISYQNGVLTFHSETEGVDYISEITDADIKKYYDATVSLTVSYNISVYATKTGYDNSDVVTATLCWIDAEPKTEGIAAGVANVPAQAVLIQSEGGVLTVEGAVDGTQVSVYAMNGTQAGSAVSRNGRAVVATSLPAGSVAIVRIGQKAVKMITR